MRRSPLPSYAIEIDCTTPAGRLGYEIVPLGRLDEESSMHLPMKGRERASALGEFRRLNTIIRDEEAYRREWSTIVETLGGTKFSEVMIGSHWLRRIVRRFPYMKPAISTKRAAEILNLIRAEAHRDVLIHYRETLCREKQ